MSKTDWEIIGDPLGTGGQSTVYKVRNPIRTKERSNCLSAIRFALDGDKRAELADAIWKYARPDSPSELAALKVFDKIRREGAAAVDRLKREIAVLEQKRPGLPELLDSNEAEQWIVTEFFPEGTLERHPSRYKGRPVLALQAFRSLLETVASLHKDKIVHRDIKPANVFIGNDGRLILGDFGIAYVSDQMPRVTLTEERVGPWDYMPQWADIGERLENVEPNFDVYMLGKLLWCMISGKSRLPREWHTRPAFDLTLIFPDKEAGMRLINSILDKCLVEEPDRCLPTAQELLQVVDEALITFKRGFSQLELNLPCHICGEGFYIARQEQLSLPSSTGHPMQLRPFFCSVCTHCEFFAPGYPQEFIKKKGRGGFHSN